MHLIGIGGAGMRNLARLLHARGIAVRGSDLKDSKGLEELAEAGAEIWVGHDPARLGSPDVVIISSAIGEANPELRAARDRGVAGLGQAAGCSRRSRLVIARSRSPAPTARPRRPR